MTSARIVQPCTTQASISLRLPAHADTELINRAISNETQAHSQGANILVRLAFYGFVLSIPLEYPERTIPVELHTLTGAIFLAVALLQPRICFRRPPAAFWLFAIYLYVWSTLGLLIGTRDASEFYTMFLIYLEEVLLFWTAYNLMRNESIAKNSLLVFILACGVMALLVRFGSLESPPEYEGRLTGMGQNPNNLAGNFALAILAVIGLAFGANRQILKFRSMYLLLIPLMGICLIHTTSRGGFMAFGIGLLAFFLKGGDARSRFKTLLALPLLLLFFIWASYYTGSMWNRYKTTVETGSMSVREEIFPDAWQMFLEKPLIGWGPVNNNYELAVRTAEEGRENPERDTHNLWLEVLTATGLLGAVPFFAGVWICSRAAWKARALTFGILPLALMIALLVLNLSMNWILTKQTWLVFAFALASSSALPGPAKRPKSLIVEFQ